MISRRSFASAGGALLVSRAARADASTLVGTWAGAVSVAGRAQRVRLDVATDGGIVFTSVDQGGVRRGGRIETAPDGAVRIQIQDVGDITGRQTAADRIDATFVAPTPGGENVKIPLVLVRGAPQAPADNVAPPSPLTAVGLEALRQGCEAPALAAVAQRRDGEMKVWATGVRMAGAASRVKPDDQWHLGSIGKSFLATLAGRLVDLGRLAWDDTLGTVLASDHPHIPAPYRDATLLHLMSHRSGLLNNLSLHQMRAFDASTAPERAQRKVFLASAFALPPVAPLGVRTAYSNIGYVAAAAMIEARTGRDWEGLMCDEVLRPLGLASAGFGAPGRKGALTEPVGHGPFFEQPYRPHLPGQPNADLPLVMGPAGRLHMSLTDLAIYLAAHRDRTGFLQPTTWDILHTPHFDGQYALGWNTWPDGSFSHDGSNLLWYAVATFNPKTGILAAAAANDGRTAVWGAVGDAVRQAGAAV